MISQSVKAAVARVAVNSPIYSRVGTAFLVSDRHLITAMHVVADRALAMKGHVPPQPTIAVTPNGSAKPIAAKLVDGCYDPLHDWALLVLEEPCAGVKPIPLAPIRRSGSTSFEAFGFPVDHGGGLVFGGDVSDAHAEYFGAEVIQLYCEQLAAGVGHPVNGLSGAPCIVHNIAVGVIRAHPVGPGAGGTDTVRHGVLYACPEAKFRDAVRRFLPVAQRVSIPVGQFATGPRVDISDVPLELINAIADLYSDIGDAEAIVEEANRIKNSFDAPAGRYYVIKRSRLVTGAGALKFWHTAFFEAGLHGPRMVAALLQAVDVERLEGEAGEQSRELLQRLRGIGQQVIDT